MSFADAFIVSQGEPIGWRGQRVYGIFRRTLVSGVLIRIERISAIPAPPQGLSLAAPKGGWFLVNGQKLEKVVLWADTAPPEVELECGLKKSPGELRIWNCWRGSLGSTDAWLNNAGILIEEASDGVVLRCSCGPGEPSFDDLIVKVSFATSQV